MEWTQGSVEKLKMLAEKQGLTATDAGRAMGISKQTALSAARRYGIVWSRAANGGTRLVENWTDEQVARLVELRTTGKSWPAVSDIIGKSETACQCRYIRELPAGADHRLRSPDLPADRMQEAVDAFNKTPSNIRRCDRATLAARAIGVRPIQLIRIFAPESDRSGETARASSKIEIPTAVAAERERRLALDHQDATAMLMGDPLPGCSALSRKQGFRQIGEVAISLVDRMSARRRAA